MCCRRVEVGIGCGTGVDTGSIGCESDGSDALTVDVSTIGDSTSVSYATGSVLVRLSCVTNVYRAFLIRLPASKLGVFVDGGFFNKVMISIAACFRNLLNLLGRMKQWLKKCDCVAV